TCPGCRRAARSPRGSPARCRSPLRWSRTCTGSAASALTTSSCSPARPRKPSARSCAVRASRYARPAAAPRSSAAGTRAQPLPFPYRPGCPRLPPGIIQNDFRRLWPRPIARTAAQTKTRDTLTLRGVKVSRGLPSAGPAVTLAPITARSARERAPSVNSGRGEAQQRDVLAGLIVEHGLDPHADTQRVGRHVDHLAAQPGSLVEFHDREQLGQRVRPRRGGRPVGDGERVERAGPAHLTPFEVVRERAWREYA